MDIKSLSQFLSPKNIEEQSVTGKKSLENYSKDLLKVQEKFNKWGISLDGVFNAQFEIIGLANKTLESIAEELEDKSSNLSRLFTTAEKGLSIYGTVKDTFANENSDGFDKASGGLSIASDVTDLGAASFMSDDNFKEYLATRESYLEEANNSSLAKTGTFFENMTKMSGKFLGEQNGVYKTLFMMSKAFSIAKSVMAIKTAIADAAAAGSFPANLAAMGTVAASTASIISDIKSVKYTGQAHDGIDYIPREGTWLLDKGERVLSPKQNADFTSFLNNSSSGDGWKINVINNAGAEVQPEVNNDEKIITIAVNRAENRIANSINSHSGPTWQAMTNSTNIKSRL